MNQLDAFVQIVDASALTWIHTSHSIQYMPVVAPYVPISWDTIWDELPGKKEKCTCDIKDLMAKGCTCGWLEIERKKEATNGLDQ